MIIRIATKEDWGAISNLSRISGYSDWINDTGIEFLESGYTMVAEGEGILGFAKAEDAGDGSMWLSALRVHPSHRRRGIGEDITKFALELAKKRGSKFARMFVEPSNQKSINLVKKLGFEFREDYSIFCGSIDTSGWQLSNLEEDVYVGAGWAFVRLKDYGLSDLSVKEREGVIVIEKDRPNNNAFQTIIISGELKMLSVTNSGYVAVPSKWQDQVAKFLKPFEDFAAASLFELKI